MSRPKVNKRFGQMIELRPEAIPDYVRCHAEVWPEVLRTIWECNIRNYSIFLRGNTLFGYFEYIGSDFEQDMRRMSQDPKTQEWWALVGPMQAPLADREKGEWWANMKEVFHCE